MTLKRAVARSYNAGTFGGGKGENLEHIMQNIYCSHLAVKGKRKLEDLERVSGLNKNSFSSMVGKRYLV